MARRKHDFVCPEWLHLELQNWARYCWRGSYPHPLPSGHCGSPEWQYERVREEGEIESVDNKPIPVNETNARIVQGVYEALPWLQQQVLRAEYPQRGRATVRVGHDEYLAALNMALFRVMAVLDGRG